MSEGFASILQCASRLIDRQCQPCYRSIVQRNNSQNAHEEVFVVNWTAEMQARLDQLRASELAGPLTAEEEAELMKLMEMLEAEEAERFAPAFTRLRAEQAALRERLRSLQTGNEELAKLLHQQEQLVADARRWLAQFEQRHLLIQQAYTKITGEALISSASS